MVNKIWIFLFIIGIGFAIYNNKVVELNNALLNAPHDSVTMILNLTGLYILWNGFLQIAKDCGLIDAFAKKIYFITKYIFPELPKEHDVHGYLASNIAANILGLGSVATPLGIKSMEEMKKINKNKKTASRSMITLILINCSCLTLLPTTIISLRKIYGSTEPTKVLPLVIIGTTLSTLCAIILDRIFYYLNKDKF
ncbi:spore maturation protein [Mycoplasmatota bacterium]|nr:spore maturation protein [Mycoplasmatota bacterium]